MTVCVFEVHCALETEIAALKSV